MLRAACRLFILSNASHVMAQRNAIRVSANPSGLHVSVTDRLLATEVESAKHDASRSRALQIANKTERNAALATAFCECATAGDFKSMSQILKEMVTRSSETKSLKSAARHVLRLTNGQTANIRLTAGSVEVVRPNTLRGTCKIWGRHAL